MLNTFYDCYQILQKVYSDGTYLKQAITSTFIEEINRDKTTKIVYGVLDKDVTLSFYIKSLCDKNPKTTIRTILKIAFYLIKFMNKPPYAVTDTAVELVKKLGKGGTSGFVNAVIRKFISTEIQLPSDKLERLSIQYSYPVFAVEKLINGYGEEKAIQIMSADTERTCVRFNKGIDGEKYLENIKFSYEKTVFDGAYFVKGFKRNQDYDKGIYTFQSIGSIAICDVVQGGDILLDACSAPGGKSVYLADKFNKVYSHELHEHRVDLITEYKTRMQKNNVFESVSDSSVYNAELDNKFDAVLCDVPCSGYGVVKDNPDIKLFKTQQNIEDIKKTQLAIIKNCSKYVKNGGALYYSTCSVFREENDGIVKEFLQCNDSFAVEEINSPLNHIKTDCGLQFTPDVSLGAGFYVAKLKRKSI